MVVVLLELAGGSTPVVGGADGVGAVGGDGGGDGEEGPEGAVVVGDGGGVVGVGTAGCGVGALGGGAVGCDVLVNTKPSLRVSTVPCPDRRRVTSTTAESWRSGVRTVSDVADWYPTMPGWSPNQTYTDSGNVPLSCTAVYVETGPLPGEIESIAQSPDEAPAGGAVGPVVVVVVGVGAGGAGPDGGAVGDAVVVVGVGEVAAGG